MNEPQIVVNSGDMGIVIAFVLLLGGIIKNYTPVKNELIPLITWALGGLIYQWLAGGWSDPRQWMMALLSVAGATGLHSASQSTMSVFKKDDNTPPTIPLVLLVGLLAFSFTGCSTPQKPPTPTEQKYFEIRTNTVDVVQLVTNVLPATATTVAAVRVEPVTNRVEQYEFVPNANAQLVATTGAAVGTTISPVAGGVVGAAIMGLFSLWGWARSKNTATATQITAKELAQIIQTGRQILLRLPDGAKYDAAWKAWMVKHQAETQTIAQVSQLVALAVDNDKAKGAAQTIVNLIQAQPK